ncbi:hypothetical protein HYFRA_00003591 [Hymenoscyphus fraxineus]|uniref:Uncharacterized protein n=1 Tax=Hymenoscyphus fraxineus TaxID=746836 RepID=A0A9N9PQW1_9HELO|nr:hypothetical protein HYFRA_00003591 [Hymenoscyphus fraxineus]
MLVTIELYIRGFAKVDEESSKLAEKVDGAISPIADPVNTKEGYRRYFKSEAQVKICREWIECVRLRLSILPPNDALDRPLSEVGYATHGITRLKSHATHRSSNYLTNLADAVCCIQQPRRFYIRQFILNYTVYYNDASFAEIMASRLALCYTSIGGGFSHHAAGLSYGGANNVEKDYYPKRQRELFSSNTFLQRRQWEYARMTKHANILRNEVLGEMHIQKEAKEFEYNLNTLEKSIDAETDKALKDRQALSDELDPLAKLLEEFGTREWRTY